MNETIRIDCNGMMFSEDTAAAVRISVYYVNGDFLGLPEQHLSLEAARAAFAGYMAQAALRTGIFENAAEATITFDNDKGAGLPEYEVFSRTTIYYREKD